MKITQMLGLMVAISFASLIVYDSVLANSPLGIIWQIINGNWNSIPLIGKLTAETFAVGTGLIFAGLFFNEKLVYAGLALGFLSWGGAYWAFYESLREEATNGLFGGNEIVLQFIVVLLLLSWIFVVVEWARGRDS